MIPAYLQRQVISEGQKKYGRLTYIESKKEWLIIGDPCVIQVAKRLFPGCNGRGKGVARFKENKRTNGDLNWLMLRYPLEIENEGIWERAINETIEHVIKREKILQCPQKVIPGVTFKGELKEFQQEGLAFLIHNRRALLADEMGLGKTVQALAFLSETQSYPALIIVPPHLVKNWEKEIRRFLELPPLPGYMPGLFNEGYENTTHVIKGLKPYKLPEANIYIIHYLLLRGWKNHLPKLGFKALIFDEIQELRHRQTEKYSAASLLSDSCENVIGLSGTPIYNRGGEIWNVMNIIEFHCLGDYESFTREWCNGYGSDIVVNPGHLGDYLKNEGLLLRRTKDLVLKELPPKRRVVQTIDFDTGLYSELIQKAVEKSIIYDSITEFTQRGRIKREIENETRQAIGIAKAGHVSTFVKMLLEAGERVLLFAYHHAVWDIYKEYLKEFNPVFITGKETATKKDHAVETFKNKLTNLCCISLRSAAGIDGLQSANCAVFGELDWSPAIHSQAEDRIQRIGVDENQDSILCYYLVCESGTDEAIQEALGLKVSQFVGLMGDKPESEDARMIAQSAASQHMDKVIEKLKELGKSKKIFKSA